jgi:CspA family cold shock protein
MEQGTVAKFDRTYGFIKRDNTGTQVFVHFSDIDQEGFKELNRGDRVEFELQATERGPKAVGVRRLDDCGSST